jgi:hypothetical protein
VASVEAKGTFVVGGRILSFDFGGVVAMDDGRMDGWDLMGSRGGCWPV